MKNLIYGVVAIVAMVALIGLGIRAYDIESNYNAEHPHTMYGSNS